MRALRARHPGFGLELLRQSEQHDGSMYYDVLLHLAGQGTVSVSFSTERTLPWPLRGVQRSSERTLLSVNGAVLWIDHAIACLVRDVLQRDLIALSRGAARGDERLPAPASSTPRRRPGGWMARRGHLRERAGLLRGGRAPCSGLS
ncbi:MAG: hypothetical protein ACRDZO_16675 [Egibacteraceae bacterium]